ncbi:DUF1835 domain-containing protein [Aureitalea marina]|uniref:DUF1835 domain-containing protein n=1 Tax=Aureitalea marina TaxID=930804 RepID=A0A2S7KRI9_9FLAO|nr:DUF1835 domain-containing protein [Aureitalea marina]PQB05241.1 DUF1835 domain-containing protein [Aureitalea marina]
MSKTYHVLNGDALKDRFPAEIEGSIIVARECLVDGDVSGDNLQAFYKNRAHFITQAYGDYSKEEYTQDTVSEFEKIRTLPEGSKVYLWFEDDLFCQVNFWFVCFLLSANPNITTAQLVRPKLHTQYGFAGLSNTQLIEIHKEPVELDNLDAIALLWTHYQSGDQDKLLAVGRSLNANYPFILRAVQAHLERIPSDDDPGRPMRTLANIMTDLNAEDFGSVFQEFNKRESIYGFGDLQVKRMYDKRVRSED